MNEREGPFYIKEGYPGHYDIVIDESDVRFVGVLYNLTEKSANRWCSRLNKAVARYVVNNNDRIGGQDDRLA